MIAAIAREFVVVDNRRVSCLIANRADGARAVVFLHAFPLNAEMWRAQLANLPPGWMGLAPDFRGFGESDPDRADGFRNGDAQLADYARDVVGILDHFQVSRAVVCGCSMGGYTQFAMHREWADRIAGLVLVDTRATADTPEGRTGRQAMLDMLDDAGPDAVAKQMLPKLVGATTMATRPGVVADVAAMTAKPTASGVGHAVVHMMNRQDATARLGTIACPTMIVLGEEDVLIPLEDAAALQMGIPGASLVLVPKAGHLPNLEQPELFNEMLRAFLDELVPGA